MPHDMARHWHSSKLVVSATFAEGPDAGKVIASVVPRSEFRAVLSRVPFLTREANTVWLDSLRADVRRQVAKGTGDLTPENDEAFMTDLVWLMAAHLVVGSLALENSGVFAIGLAINPDTEQPWTRRGFLSRDHVMRPDMVVEIF